MRFCNEHFSAAAMRRGARRCLPLILGTIPFGIVTGVLAQQRGLSALSAMVMSATVYTGAGQVLALGIWTHPAPIFGAFIAVFAVSLRLALMGPVLSPWLDRLRGWRLFAALYVMADQNWAMSVAEMRAGRADAGFLFGSGLMMWSVWVASNGVGQVLGDFLRLPGDHPVFFVSLATFTALLVPMWRGRGDLLPWAVAAVTGVAVAHLLPGTTWHIVVAAVAGSTAAVLRDRLREG